MTQREARCLFTKLIAELTTWIFSHDGWEINFSEGYVKDTDAKDGDYDGPHKKGGTHYLGTGIDINLFVDGVWINSNHTVWHIIGNRWKLMSPLCRWGGDFPQKDYNHFSIAYGGQA